MKSKIRVLICDDTHIMRRLIRATLSSDPKLEVICEAIHGKEAVQKVKQHEPDVVIMDVEMPIMDGIDAVREIRRLQFETPIIMFSTLTTRGAEATFDALNAGATDCAEKPSSLGHIANAMEKVKNELVPRIYRCMEPIHTNVAESPPNPLVIEPQSSSTMPTRSMDSPPPDSPETMPTAPQMPNAPSTPSPCAMSEIAAFGVGTSTGGPQALSNLLQHLPLNFPVPILIVQHMPAKFTKLLAERLAQKHGHPVREAHHGQEIKAGDILIAPGDKHLTTFKDRNRVVTQLTDDPPINSCRPAVDPLFESMARSFGNRCTGIVLTGMGTDGTEGARALRQAGGRILVQDKQSSVVWGMPGSIADSGLANGVMPIEQIAQEMIRATMLTHTQTA